MNRKIRTNIFGPNRQSIRLQGYDYSSDATYFITICTQDRVQLFGEIINGQMILSSVGEMVKNAWLDLPGYDSRILLDEFMVMPDHFHGIIVIDRDGSDRHRGQARGPALTISSVGADPRVRPQQRVHPQSNIRSKPMSIPDIIHRFKSWTTHQYMALHIPQEEKPRRLWLRNYYERIIRSDEELEVVRQYIRDNPKNWKP